jgi:hypothetical protein
MICESVIVNSSAQVTWSANRHNQRQRKHTFFFFCFSLDYVKENTYNYILLSYSLSSFTLQKLFCVCNINFKCLWKRKCPQWLIQPNNMIWSITVEYNVYTNLFQQWPHYHVMSRLTIRLPPITNLPRNRIFIVWWRLRCKSQWFNTLNESTSFQVIK